jgi:hypothetical protein
MRKVFFRTENFSFAARFNDSSAALKLLEGMPITSLVSTWGDEIYFDTGIEAPAAGATLDVSPGDIAYWPDGTSLCIFFGRTPASRGTDKPAPASPVVIVGRTDAAPEDLRSIRPGEEITVSIGD